MSGNAALDADGSRAARTHALGAAPGAWLARSAWLGCVSIALAGGLVLASAAGRMLDFEPAWLSLAGPALGLLVARKPIRAAILRLRTDGNALLALLGAQILAVLTVLLVPFGFDHPSSCGLDFDHLLVVAVLYALAWALGIAAAVALRRWGVLLAELAIPAIFALLLASGSLSM